MNILQIGFLIAAVISGLLAGYFFCIPLLDEGEDQRKKVRNRTVIALMIATVVLSVLAFPQHWLLAAILGFVFIIVWSLIIEWNGWLKRPDLEQ